MSKKKDRGYLWSEEGASEEEPVAEVEVEPVAEVEVEPEVEEMPKKKSKSKVEKLVVTSLRAHLFESADVFSKKVGGVSRGNLLLVKSKMPGWYEVELPLVSGRVPGFIEASRVMEA